MLKHVSYRSTSLGRGTRSEFSSCRGSNTPEKYYRGDLTRTPDYSTLQRRTLGKSGDVPDGKCQRSHDMSAKDDSGFFSPNNSSVKEDLDDISFSNYKSADSLSLTSAFSFTSLASSRFSTSRCSSTLSLNDPSGIPVKVYLRRLRPDMEYKTLSLTSATSCRELINSLLTKFRLRHRDPNLFFVLMEVTVRSPSDSTPLKKLLVLDDDARPAELQQCRPKGEARFSIGVRRGGLVRVHDSILMQGSQYKSLLISYDTTSEELIQLLLTCYSLTENPSYYSIHEVCKIPYTDRPLGRNECPLRAQADWPKANREHWSLVLRRNITYTLNLKSKLRWRRSLDQSSTDTESEIEDHNTTRASIMSTSSSSSNASSSSGVSSDSVLSSSSSSGVSSGDSCLSSPNSSPQKITPRLLISSKGNEGLSRTLPARVLPSIEHLKKPLASTTSLEAISRKAGSGPSIPPPTKMPTVPSSTPAKESEVKVPEKIDKPPELPPRNSTSLRSLPPTEEKDSSLPPKNIVRPPKPVPRTLFPSFGNTLSLKKENLEVNLSSTSSPSPTCNKLNNGYAHSSPKHANVRCSLSKSFANLSLLSPISPNKSTSLFYFESSPLKIPQSPPFNKVKNLTASQKHLDTTSCYSPSPKLTSSKSEFNLTQLSTCYRNCEHCFYI